ncbi:MAG: nucleotidyltransferase family protein [Burkholderiaceae bacterium]
MGLVLEGGGGPCSRVVVGAVVLAAGAGERIGRRPKCLLELGGVSLIRRTLIALSGAGVDEVVVVLGHHADEIAPVVETFPVTVVHNPRPEDGQVSSQRVGLAALSGKLDAVMVVLADQPLLDVQDLVALLAAWQKRAAGIDVIFPEVGGQRGNPVVFSADVRDEILAGEATVGCRQWQGRHPDRVMSFTTDNRRYRIDIDTDDDLQRFERETGHALRWPVRSPA